MAARGASVLAKALENPQETDPGRLARLASALAALATRMNPEEAASVAARGASVLAKALEDPQETNPDRLSGLGSGGENPRREPGNVLAKGENPRKESDAIRGKGGWAYEPRGGASLGNVLAKAGKPEERIASACSSWARVAVAPGRAPMRPPAGPWSSQGVEDPQERSA